MNKQFWKDLRDFIQLLAGVLNPFHWVIRLVALAFLDVCLIDAALALFQSPLRIMPIVALGVGLKVMLEISGHTVSELQKFLKNYG